MEVSERLLLRQRSAGLEQQILGVHLESATRLESLQTESLDAVLLLGPLYHLRSEVEKHAVAEATRILRPAGILFAAGIKWLAYLRDVFLEQPVSVVQRKEFQAGSLRGGIDPDYAPPICSEQYRRRDLSNAAHEAGLWLDLIEETSKTREGITQSHHFLFIGRKLV